MYRHNSVLEILTMLPLQLRPLVELPTFADQQILPFAPLALDLKAASDTPLAHCPQWQLDCLIHLNFSELQAFTMVREQYQQWGIEFEGAIALQPSNPAFIDSKQPIGLMPTLERTPLTIYFHHPRQVVSARLTGVQQVSIRAFDTAGRLVSEQCLGQFAYLCGCASGKPSNHEMQLQAAEIARIEILSEAPFLLRNLVCG